VKGYSLIAGVDEVGRSAWAGPMVAAAVILQDDFDPTGIRSSKRIRHSPLSHPYDRTILMELR
jgi:ribonuclease HII